MRKRWRSPIGRSSGRRPTGPPHLRAVNQMSPNFDGSAYPARARLPTPTVALMTVPGANVKPEKTTTRVGDPKGSRVHHLLTSDAVSTPSRVFPMAIATEVAIDPNVIAPARNAP